MSNLGSNFGFVNIKGWNSEQVGKWMKGLEDNLQTYVNVFVQHEVNGKQLLDISAYELDKMGIHKVGHQELLLEAVDQLKALHFSLDSENAQSIAMKLGIKAKSIANEIKTNREFVEYEASKTGKKLEDVQRKIPVRVLYSVSDTVYTIKHMVSWLSRAPFDNSDEYITKRNDFVNFGRELVTSAQDESTMKAENEITETCNKLSQMCDNMIRNSKDPLTIQPASLELATIRKKPEDDLGMRIQSTHNGIHIIGEIKEKTPAHLCDKIEEGDEVVQVNYQTVVGWHLKKFVQMLKENKKEVVLTLKKRPRHIVIAPRKKPNHQTSTFPKRISKRKSRNKKAPFDDFVNSVPTQPTSNHNLDEIVKEECQTEPPNVSHITEADDNDNVFRSGSESPAFNMINQLPVFEESTKQRRATVSGGSPILKQPPIQFTVNSPVRPKSYTITVSSPSSEGSYPSFDMTSPEIDVTSGRFTRPSEASSDVTETTESTSLDTSTADSESQTDANLTCSSPGFLSVNSQTPPLPSLTPPSTCITPPSSASSSPSPSDLRMAKMNVLIESPKRRKASEQAAKLLPGMAHEKGSPALIRVNRIDSRRRAELAEQERGGNTSPESSGRNTPDVDRVPSLNTGYTVNIVGGVPQKMPLQAQKELTDSPGGLLRRKHIVRKMGAHRRISCKDLGKGDCQGWLLKRKEGGNKLTSKWVKRWFVLKEQNLYYYKDPEDLKAQGVIHLPGFKISPAKEMKTKKFAFKAHHSGTTFYFASERIEDMSKWMNKMGLSAIVYDTSKLPTTAGFNRVPEKPQVILDNPYYSESDDDESEKGSPAISRECSRENLLAAVPSETDLVLVYKNIKRAEITLDGADMKKKRQSHMARPETLVQPEAVVSLEDVEHIRKLSSLQRTLRSKQQELDEIEKLLSTPSISHGTLNDFLKVHKDIVEPKTETSEVSSESDVESSSLLSYDTTQSETGEKSAG